MRERPVIAALAVLSAGAIFALQLASASPAQDPGGKVPYEENCRKCHGVRGIPPKTMKAKYEKIPNFDAEFFEKHSADSIVNVLTKGKNENMKSFKGKLTPEEMKQVADYIRTFGGGSGS
jgi:mono/diheme cytochrome c family protein